MLSQSWQGTGTSQMEQSREGGAGPQMQPFKNALWISSFLWRWGKQWLVPLQTLRSLLGRAASVLPPQLRSRYLGSPFPCHFPFPPIAWVCSLQLGNPCDTFPRQTPELDAEQMNLFNQFLNMANFLCTCFGIPESKKSRSLTKHFTLTCLNRTRGNSFFLFFFSISIPTPATKKGWGGLCKTSLRAASRQDRGLAAHQHGIPVCAQAGVVNTRGGGGRGGEGRPRVNQSVICARNLLAFSCPYFQNANILKLKKNPICD